MDTDVESIRKICEECGTVFKLDSENEKGIKKRQKIFADAAEVLEQKLICCEECATLRMIKLL